MAMFPAVITLTFRSLLRDDRSISPSELDAQSTTVRPRTERPGADHALSCSPSLSRTARRSSAGLRTRCTQP